MADAVKLTVIYDGCCPLCDREIAFYRGRKGAEGISWIDAAGLAGGKAVPGPMKHQAWGRCHVLYPDGTLVSGGEAFAALWSALPGFRRFAWLFSPVDSMHRDRHSGKFPDWLIRVLRSDHARHGENDMVEDNGASLAGQGKLDEAIARRRPRAMTGVVHRKASP